MNVIFNFIKQ